MRRIGMAGAFAASLMAASASVGTQATNVGAPQAPGQSKEMMAGEATQRRVAKMVLKRKRARISGDPFNDGFDDYRKARAEEKRARKRQRPQGHESRGAA